MAMEDDSLYSSSVIPNSYLGVKEEIEIETEVPVRFPTDDNVVKKEDGILDTKTNGYILDNIFELNAVKTEPTEIILVNESDKPVENKPFTLCLVDDDGNVIEEYIEKNGNLTPIVEMIRRPLKRKKNGRRKKRKLSNKSENGNNGKGKYMKLDHKFKHHSYRCSVCQKSLEGRKNFREHMGHHMTEVNDTWQCHVCWYQTNKRGHMTRHLVETHCLDRSAASTEVLYNCTLCEQRFFHSKDLSKHMYVHTRQGSYKCDMCDFSHTSMYSLRKHKRSHYDTPRIPREKPFECHHCGYRCESKRSISDHIYRHLGLRQYQCNKCDQLFFGKSDLTKHLAAIHSDYKPFSCNGCSKTFYRKAHLVLHNNSKTPCNKRIKRMKKNIVTKI